MPLRPFESPKSLQNFNRIENRLNIKKVTSKMCYAVDTILIRMYCTCKVMSKNMPGISMQPTQIGLQHEF